MPTPEPVTVAELRRLAERVRALSDAASSAPWHMQEHDESPGWFYVATERNYSVVDEPLPQDGDLIVGLRNDAPAIAAALSAAADELAALRRFVASVAYEQGPVLGDAAIGVARSLLENPSAMAAALLAAASDARAGDGQTTRTEAG